MLPTSTTQLRPTSQRWVVPSVQPSPNRPCHDLTALPLVDQTATSIPPHPPPYHAMPHLATQALSILANVGVNCIARWLNTLVPQCVSLARDIAVAIGRCPLQAHLDTIKHQLSQINCMATPMSEKMQYLHENNDRALLARDHLGNSWHGRALMAWHDLVHWLRWAAKNWPLMFEYLPIWEKKITVLESKHGSQVR